MRRTFCVLSMVGMLVLSAAPASATVIERGRGTDSWDETDSSCGFDVHVAGELQFNYRIREGKNQRDQAFFLHNVYSFQETLTAGDRSVTISFRGMFNEVRAVPLGDGRFQFHDVEAVNLTVRDASGKVIGLEAGVIRSTYEFDTLNDDEPGGEIIGDITSTVVGRFDDLDPIICAALAP